MTVAIGLNPQDFCQAASLRVVCILMEDRAELKAQSFTAWKATSVALTASSTFIFLMSYSHS